MRVLLIASWSIGQPRHGGALRAAAIAAEYAARGHIVAFSGLYDPRSTPPGEIGRDDYPLIGAVHEHYGRDPSTELTFWEGFAEVPAAFAHFTRLVESFKPDVIQFEEPYMWPVVRALMRLGHTDGVAIVHSSYNYETEAKHALKASGLPITQRTLDDVARIEREIAQTVSAIVAVSDADAEAFRSLGARRVLVAPNGSGTPTQDPKFQDALRQYLLGEPFALFVSSAHPPNAAGLLELAERTSVRLTQGALIVAGSVANLVYDTPAFWRNQHIFARTRFLGTVSAPMLGALYSDAAIVVLPKTRGGGSNLKTAEALRSGRPIVGTSMAFQGFERFRQMPGVVIEDDPDALWSRVAAALAQPPSATQDAVPFRDVEDLSWSACLRPMMEVAEELGSRRPDQR